VVARVARNCGPAGLVRALLRLFAGGAR